MPRTRCKVPKAAVALLGVCLLTSEVTSAPLSEEQLATLEKGNARSSSGVQPSWDKLITRFPQLAFLAAFDTACAAAQSASTPTAATGDGGMVRLAPDNAGSASTSTNDAARGYGRTSDAAAFASATTTTMNGGMVPGMPAHMVGGALAVASIGFNVLQFFSGGTLDDKIRASSIKDLNAPSLYLLKTGGLLKDDAARYAQIVADQTMIQSFGLKCDPARAHQSRDATVGGALQGIEYTRFIFCGFDPEEEVSYFSANEMRGHKVVSVTGGSSLQVVYFTRLDEMDKMPAVLGLQKGQMREAGRVLYEKIKDKLDPQWTALFTAAGADGKWHVYVARNNVIGEFESPPKN